MTREQGATCGRTGSDRRIRGVEPAATSAVETQLTVESSRCGNRATPGDDRAQPRRRRGAEGGGGGLVAMGDPPVWPPRRRPLRQFFSAHTRAYGGVAWGGRIVFQKYFGAAARRPAAGKSASRRWPSSRPQLNLALPAPIIDNESAFASLQPDALPPSGYGRDYSKGGDDFPLSAGGFGGAGKEQLRDCG